MNCWSQVGVDIVLGFWIKVSREANRLHAMSKARIQVGIHKVWQCHLGTSMKALHSGLRADPSKAY